MGANDGYEFFEEDLKQVEKRLIDAERAEKWREKNGTSSQNSNPVQVIAPQPVAPYATFLCDSSSSSGSVLFLADNLTPTYPSGIKDPFQLPPQTDPPAEQCSPYAVLGDPPTPEFPQYVSPLQLLRPPSIPDNMFDFSSTGANLRNIQSQIYVPDSQENITSETSLNILVTQQVYTFGG